MRCAHCHGTRREVSLWAQILNFGQDTVCCLIPTITNKPKRGARR